MEICSLQSQILLATCLSAARVLLGFWVRIPLVLFLLFATSSRKATHRAHRLASPPHRLRIISLLRMAQERFPSTSRPRERPWWEDQDSWQGPAVASAWPPKRLPKLQTMWVAVDAADPSRQGRTVDGHIYYWNRETNETSWTRPWGGRRSEQVRTRLRNLLGTRGAPFGARLMRKAAGGMLGRCSSGRQRQRDQASLGLVLEYMGTRGRKPARQAVMQGQP